MLPGVTTPGFVNLKCDPLTNEWSEDTTWPEPPGTPALTITLYDPLYQCCALPREPIHVQWSDTRNRWEPSHPHGLHRKAKVTDIGGIYPGSSGEVEIYSNDNASGVIVDAWLIWVYLAQSLIMGDNVYIVYDSDEKRWVVLGLDEVI
jgi:hypothetical protein